MLAGGSPGRGIVGWNRGIRWGRGVIAEGSADDKRGRETATPLTYPPLRSIECRKLDGLLPHRHLIAILGDAAKERRKIDLRLFAAQGVLE